MTILFQTTLKKHSKLLIHLFLKNWKMERSLPMKIDHTKFEGYQIYQLLDNSISPTELDDVEKARLIFQCDKVNDVENVINFEYDETV